jgi:hypothetical protein
VPYRYQACFGAVKAKTGGLDTSTRRGRYAGRATIPSAVARAAGRPYEQEFDGEHDIYSVEGPVVKELGSYANDPRDVAEWYEAMARDVMRAVGAADARARVAAADGLWRGPASNGVRRQAD